MSGMFSWAFKSNKELGNSEIPEIFALSIKSDVFVKSDIHSTYSKILTDVAERCHGLADKVEPLLWDNCLQSEGSEGLISLLASAMTNKTDLYLVYAKSAGIIRKATQDEEAKIRADYTKQASSSVGIFISFKKYRRTDMLEIYSAMEYCVLSSLNKTVNVAKSVQFKIGDLRSSVGLADAGIAREQAKSISEAMRNGNDVLLDAKDSVATATPDTSPTEKAIGFLDAKRAFILGLPLSYIVGEQVGGLNNTGEADLRAVERGLKQYFVSIVRPVLEAIFGGTIEFRSQDFRQMETALEVLKSFELTSDEYLSKESKQEIVARVFDLDPEQEQKNLAAEEKEREANPDTALGNGQRLTSKPNQDPQPAVDNGVPDPKATSGNNL